MSSLVSILAILQAVGAVIGAGGSVVGELFYLRAIQDGYIDGAERAHLRIIAAALRWGMIILLLADIGLVLAAYVTGAALQPAFSTPYWIQSVLALIIIAASWGLSRRRIPFWFGSGASFAAWWYIALLDLGRLPTLTFGSSLAYYALAAAIIMAVLAYARMLIRSYSTS